MKDAADYKVIKKLAETDRLIFGFERLSQYRKVALMEILDAFLSTEILSSKGNPKEHR